MANISASSKAQALAWVGGGGFLYLGGRAADGGSM